MLTKLGSFAASAVLFAALAPPSFAADASRGAEVFQDRCARCHAISAGEPGKRGPYLAGLFQRAPGSVKGFPYRMVYTEAGAVWSETSLDNYLVIHLLSDDADRRDVIAYLKQATASQPPAK